MRAITCLLLLLFLGCLLPTGIIAQNKVILSGKVTDVKGMPIPSVSIAVENTTWGTYTNEKGDYSLQLTQGEHTLSISCLGYHTQQSTFYLQGNQKQNFVLQENSVVLKQVNIYGKSQEQKIRESVFSVNALSIEPISNSLNNLNELVNRTTGIKVREEGGVGSDFDLSINGLSGNSVRYFLDGIPLEAKGSGVTLSNLPVNIIDRIEIYKGVVPASLGTDALGGAVNIITKQEKKNYLDVSYSVGSFHTHRANLNTQFIVPQTGLILRPTLGINYSKNDYLMKDIEVWDESSRKFVLTNRKRFHDDYFSLLGQIEMGFINKPWADAFFISGSYSQINKELQTGSVQNKVYGMAEKGTDAWNVSARYHKRNFLLKEMQLNASLSHTWDHSLTTDTAYRKYDWNGEYIASSRNEITGRGRSIRHYKRPLTIVRNSLDYPLNPHHRFNLNYLLSRTGNKRYDEIDSDFEASTDVLCKHILSISYLQSLFKERINNTFFIKEYINHLNINQTDLSSITGSKEIKGSHTHHYTGYGAGSRLTIAPPLSFKLSYEHSIRLPLAHELLGNGSTIYANVALKPENSNNVNLGFFGTWYPASEHTLCYEVNGFLRNVDNYIQAVVSEKEGTMQYENVPAVHIKGIEGEIRYDWQNRLQLTTNISFQEARDQQKYKTDGKLSATYKNRVPNRPWLFGNAEASYVFHHVGLPASKLRIGGNYQWVHWFFLTWEAYGSRDSKARIPAQHLCNAYLTYSWERERYNISLECSNLFDKATYDNYKLQKPGRAFFAKFRLFIH